MTRVPILDENDAPEESRPVLEAIRKAWGMVPPAFGGLASNPAILAAQWAKHQAVMRHHDRVTPVMKQALALVVSAHNGCSYCTWAHALALRRLGVAEQEIERIQGGTASGEPLRSVVTLGLQIAQDATRIDAGLFAGLRQRGFADADLVEVVAVASYFNDMNRLLDALGVEAPVAVANQP